MKKIIYILLISAFLFSLFLGTGSRDGFILAEQEQEKIELKVDVLLSEAKKAYYIGQSEKALNIYNKILEVEPINLTALKNIFFLYKEIGKLEKAIPYNQRILMVIPDNQFWNYQLGVSYFLLNKTDEAKKVLADLYLKYYQEDNDIPVTTDRLKPREEVLLYYYLGRSYEKLGQDEKAFFFHRLGAEKMPQITLNQIALGKLYEKEKIYDKAREAYRSALKRDNSLSFLYPRLASIYEAFGENDTAMYYWRRSIATGNDEDEARKRLEYLKRKYPELEKEYLQEKEKKRAKAEFVKVTPITGKEKIPQVRIGLVEEAVSLEFKAGSIFEFVKKKTGEVILEGFSGTEWSIILKEDNFHIYNKKKLIKELPADGPLLLRMRDDSHTFLVYNISYGKGYFWAGQEDRQYRGELEIFPRTSNRFHLVNIINLEEYLYSVVPAEMYAWWPEEALKVQAVAARTYALRHINRHKKDGYNLCAGVHCAVYKGVTGENSKTNKAVRDTLGEAIYYGSHLISAVFTSNSGGYSESSEEIWGYKHDYLEGANNITEEEEYIFPLEPYRLEEWLLEEPDSYSSHPLYAGFNKYRWIKLLNGNYLKKKYGFNNIKDIIPSGRSKGGTIEQILIRGEDDQGQIKEKVLKKDYIRGGLGGLKSRRFVMDKHYDDNGSITRVVFFGSGFGHNVGMDQTGAAGMAKADLDYQEIIKHFYTGTRIKKVY